ARWVDKGDVLLVSKVFQRGTKVQSLPVEWALLQVLEAPAEGVCRCRLYFRYKNPGPLQMSPGVLGVRCLKVSTVKGRLRLRLIDDQAHGAKAAQQVAVSGDGFKSNAAENLSSDSDGIVQTSETYQNVAFVEVKTSGGAVAAEVPVAMLGHGVVECPVSISERAETQGGLELQKRLMLGQVSDSLAVAGQLFEELSRLVKDKSHEGALEKAGKGLKDLDADLAREKADRKAFLARAKELGLEGDVALTDGEQQLFQELADRRQTLDDFIRKLKETIQKERDPAIREANAMVQQGGLLEDRGEYDKALALYADALPKLPEGEGKRKLREYADKLRKKWAPKSDKHKEARAFIYNEWPKLQTAQELKDNLQKAKDAREACKEAGDRLTLRYLYLSSSAQLTGLENELAPLKSQQGEDAEKKRKLISEMSEAVYEFYKDVGKYLQSGKPVKK
ncbi:MAG TPA: hypothetical protein VG013_11095, partial [Gemmataceae bacterium]|nr:hypothetical protein [Gemmataceae bacterium]